MLHEFQEEPTDRHKDFNTMSEQNNKTFEERMRELGGNANIMTRTGGAVGDAVNAVVSLIAQFGAAYPILEGIISFVLLTVAGYPVGLRIALISPQIAALFLAYRYSDTPMTDAGQRAIRIAELAAVANTGLALVLALLPTIGIELESLKFIEFLLVIPILIAGNAYYVAIHNTYSAVLKKKQHKIDGDNEMADKVRIATATLAQNTARDSMQTTRLEMQANATERMANDPLIQQIQVKALYAKMVADMMASGDVHPSSKLGKQLVALADKAVMSDETQPDFDMQGLRPLSLNEHVVNGTDFLANGNGHKNGVR